MAQGFTQDEIDILNGIARQSIKDFWSGNNQQEKQKVNTYEKTVIKSYMNIEYGSAASIEQLTMGYGYFGAVIDKIKSAGFNVPGDLQTAFDACERDLKIKIRDNRLKEIQTLKLRRETLLPNEDKLRNINAEIARLEELTK